MPIPLQTKEFDPFARAVPGQSFTDEPGLRPYERPPQAVDPDQLAKVLEREITEPKTAKALSDLADIGISIETLADGLMQKCFVEGVCSPDVAEIVKPIIFMIIAQVAYDHDVEDIVLFNEMPEEEGLSERQKVGLMQQLAPNKFERLAEGTQKNNQIQNDYDEEISSFYQQDQEEGEAAATEQSPTESFLDMEDSEPVEYKEEEVI